MNENDKKGQLKKAFADFIKVETKGTGVITRKADKEAVLEKEDNK